MRSVFDKRIGGWEIIKANILTWGWAQTAHVSDWERVGTIVCDFMIVGEGAEYIL